MCVFVMYSKSKHTVKEEISSGVIKKKVFPIDQTFFSVGTEKGEKGETRTRSHHYPALFRAQRSFTAKGKKGPQKGSEGEIARKFA